MGGRGSSSSKKKRDKTSLQKKDSNKAARIHTSNSNHKNKKPRTTTSSSDDPSLSSDTSTDYKRKKKKTKQSRSSLKKRARERSSKPVDSSGKKKKRKRSSRDYVDKAINKSSKRKKPRKCSSTQTNSIESYQARQKHKVRYPSVSHDGELLPLNKEVNNNNSRRLRSVIAVVDHHQYDEGENRWDPHKEEIVYDPNDFPSPKSLDSNEVGIEVVLDDRYFCESGALGNDGELQLEVADMSSNMEKEKDIDTSVPVNALDCDLESILRQKALENMKKFKGRLQTDRMSTKESDADRPSDVMVGKELVVQGTTNSQEVNLNSENVEEESRINTCPKGETNDAGSNSVAGLACSSTRLEGENESKGGSEFKEKTMSVMKGGEMVQVSYKVYIPKKSPAIARKPLKR